MAGATPCSRCGQANTDGTEFCVRCGTRLPDPAATQVANQYGQGAPEYPWEPPAEWDPGHTPAAAPSPPPPTWASQPAGQWGPQPGQAPPSFPAGSPPAPPAGAGRSRKPLIVGGAVVVVIAVVIAVVLIVAGGKSGPKLNGVQNQSGTQALATARSAFQAANSVEIKGLVNDSGQSIQIDLTLAGDNSQGTLTINGDDVQLIKVGSLVYIKGDMDFLKQYAGNDPTVLNQLDGRWLKVPNASDFDGSPKMASPVS